MQDAIGGEMSIILLGRRTLKIENYRSILLYTDEHVRIQAKHDKVNIKGKHLCIRYYDKDEMEICGMIASIRFE